MNIFAIDSDPFKAVEYMVDKHVVKMVVETAQILSTAHHVLDKPINSTLYKKTHVNHPSTVWARQSDSNYSWLYNHFIALLFEYTYRYGKIHKTSRLIDELAKLPRNIPHASLTPIPCAMDDFFIISNDFVENYRNYYRLGKSHLHAWKKRDVPYWIDMLL